MPEPPGSEATATPEARRELLRRLLEARAGAAADEVVSLQQERLWVAHHVDPGDPSQNLRTAMRVEGRLDVDALERSLAIAVSRHDQLRATFHEVDGRPVARITPTVDIELHRLDLRHLSAAERDADIDRQIREQASHAFDLQRGPLVRLALLTLSESESVAVLAIHHIVCDAWSMDLLLRELLANYESLVSGRAPRVEAPPAAHRDFARAQLAALSGASGNAQAEFWRRQLGGYSARSLMPYDAERPAGTQMTSRRLAFELGDLRDGVEQIARSRGATVYMVLLATFAALLHRLSGSTDIVVASPVANRQEEAWEGIVGYFVNLLPLRIVIAPEAGFDDILSVARRQVLEAQEHQILPVHKIAEAAGLRPAVLLRALYQHVAAPTRRMESAGIVVEPRPVDLGKTRHDLSLTTFAEAGTLAGILEYSTDLLTEVSAARLVGDLEAVLAAVVGDVGVRVSQLPVSADWDRAGVTTEAASPAATTVEKPRTAPPSESNAGESTVAALSTIWSAVLGIDGISPFDNFLDLGGDSLLAMQVIERVETELGVRMAPADLFTQTLAQLAASLEARRG